MNKQQIINKQLSDYDNGSDGRVEYPELFNLFKNHKLRIDIDHPVGEDVINVDGKFNGYASDWVDMLLFAETFDIKYSNYTELYDNVINYKLDNGVKF